MIPARRLGGRVVIVTGAAQRIGAAARSIAAQGAGVVIADVYDASQTVRAIESAGGNAVSVPTDVADEAVCTAMVEAA